MRILATNKFYYIKGGAERFYFDLNKLLESKGHETIPFSMHDDKNLESKYSNYFVSNVDIESAGFGLNDLRAAGRILYSWEARKKIRGLIKETQPDIAHIHNIYHQISPSILTELKKAGIPIVMSVHDYKLMCPNYIFYTQGSPCTRCKKTKYYNCVLHKCVKNSYMASKLNMFEMYLHRLTKMYMSNIDVYIAPSQFVADKLVEFGYDADKVKVLRHFANYEDIAPNYENDGYMLYFGRLSKEKGVHTLLMAIKGMNIKLKIAGHGPQEDDLKQHVKNAKMENVEFLGYLSGDELQEAIQNSAFTIIPSAFYEPFGLTVIESYAHGKPVIGSDMGGIKELINDGGTGYIFESGDVDSLKEKINNMLANNDNIMRMGRNGRKYIENELNKEKYYRELRKVYKGIVAK